MKCLCTSGIRRGRRCGFRGGRHSVGLFDQTQQRLSLVVPLGFGTWRTVKTAIPAFEERDASTPACGLARFFALVKARDFSRRTFHVNLTGASIAFGTGNGFAPCIFRACVCVCVCVCLSFPKKFLKNGKHGKSM